MEIMETSRHRQLQQVVALSRQMLDQAKAMEWARVAELECERKRLVQEIFRRPVDGQEAPGVAAAIREILRLNEQVTRLGQECRDRLGGELHSHKRGRTASAAYLSHAR